MPIKPENRARYPADWQTRRRFIIEHRAGRRCEWCGVRQYAVGNRDKDGRFEAATASCGAPQHEFATYSDARAFAGDEEIVIVLTIAHIHDKRPEAASLLNLAALCQRCHNRHDAADRRRSRLRSTQAAQLDLIESR